MQAKMNIFEKNISGYKENRNPNGADCGLEGKDI